MGFTLVELMVAIAVTSVLILAINAIFANVSAGVTTGIANSDVLAANRVVAKQLQRDFDEMVGPLENGVLVIVNQRIGNPADPDDGVFVLPTDDLNENGSIDAGDITRDARIDQLVFIRRRGDLEPLAPGTTNGFANSTDAMYAKVWYGHCRRTASDGSMSSVGRLGRPDNTDSALGVNQLAGDWILGRQALFLQLASPTTANANGAFYNANGSGLSFPYGPELYKGYTDIAEYGLGSEDAGTAQGAIVGGKEDTTAANANKRLWIDLTATQYINRATDYTYVRQRLWCNPSPEGAGFESWRIAQMHPYLAGHVSDFVVEFAGDYFGAGSVAPGTTTMPNSTPNKVIDTYSDGSIIWYGLDIQPPPNAVHSQSSAAKDQKPIRGQYSNSGNIHKDVRYVFRHGPGGTNWPYLIRIRYRLLDHRGKLLDTTGEPGRWFELVLPVKRTGSTYLSSM